MLYCAAIITSNSALVQYMSSVMLGVIRFMTSAFYVMHLLCEHDGAACELALCAWRWSIVPPTKLDERNITQKSLFDGTNGNVNK